MAHSASHRCNLKWERCAHAAPLSSLTRESPTSFRGPGLLSHQPPYGIGHERSRSNPEAPCPSLAAGCLPVQAAQPVSANSTIAFIVTRPRQAVLRWGGRAEDDLSSIVLAMPDGCGCGRPYPAPPPALPAVSSRTQRDREKAARSCRRRHVRRACAFAERAPRETQRERGRGREREGEGERGRESRSRRDSYIAPPVQTEANAV